MDSESTDTAAAIYWLTGAKAADNYADFYDNTWDSYTARNEAGATISGNVQVFSGSNSDGTTHSLALGHSSSVRFGRVASGSSPLNYANSAPNVNLRFYALSPIFKVASNVTITGGNAVTEGTDARFTITANPSPSANLTVAVRVADDDAADFVASAREGRKISIIPSSGSAVTRLVNTTADTTDEPDGEITLSFVSAPSYVAGSPSSAKVVVKDDDPTIVRLARVGTGAINEGSTVEFTVTLGRALIAGEIIDVPLAVSGTGVTTADWSMAPKAGNSLNTGVTLSDQTTTTPNVRFSGAGARTATLILTAASDNTAESGGETYTIALGPNDNTANGFDHSSLGTNVGGGADPSGTASERSFDVTVNDLATLSLGSVTSIRNAETLTQASGITEVRLSPAQTSATPFRACFSSSLPTSSFQANRGITILTLDAQGCVDFSIAASSTSAGTLDIYGTDDTTDEPDEVVTITLSADPDNPLPAVVSIDTDADSATVTIRDDDPTIVTLARVGTGAINEGSTVEFTVTLGRALIAGEIIDVPLAVSGAGVTTADWSMAPKAGNSLNTGVTLSGQTTTTPNVRFSGAGAQTASLILTAATDNTAESGGSETYTIALGPNDNTANGFDHSSLGTNVGGGADPSSTASETTFDVTVNDPPMPVVQFASSTAMANEGTSTTSVSLTAAPAFTSATNVSYGVSGTATSGTDFTALSGTVSMTGGATAITITITNDAIDEDNETIILTLGSGSGYTVGTRNAVTITINDNDTAGVTISESGTPPSTSVAEDGGTDTYTVVLDSEPTSNVTITPSSGTTAAATVSGALTFTSSNWDTAQTVTVTGVNDNTTGNRSSTITHAASSTDTNYSGISIGSVTATVVDDDGGSALPTVSITGGSAVTEGSNATFTVTRTGGTTAALTVLLRVSENENNGRDFVASSNERDDTVTIPIGSGSVNYTVATVGDSTHKPNGEVRLFLRESASAYTRNNSSATVTVNDDDAPSNPTTPSVSFASASMSVAENVSSFMVQVNLSPRRPRISIWLMRQEARRLLAKIP